MAKTNQEELLLQADVIGHKNDPKKGPYGLLGQGFWVSRTADMWKKGKPDLRIARKDVGQLDVELKYCAEDRLGDKDIDVGFTGLQWLNIKTMNEHGVPAIGLVYLSRLNTFVITNDRVLRPGLWSPAPPFMVSRHPFPAVIFGTELFATARAYLNG